MRTIHKPIIATLPITRVGDMQSVVYGVSVDGETLYTGEAVVINRQIKVRIDDILRDFAFRYGWIYDEETQMYKPDNIGEYKPVSNYIFDVEVASSGQSVSIPCTTANIPSWRVDVPTINNTRLIPHIPFVATDKLWLIGLLNGDSEGYSIRYKDNIKAEFVGEQAKNSKFVLSMHDILAGEVYAEKLWLADVNGKNVDILAITDDCPNLKPYYLLWQTPEGGAMVYGFGGNKTDKITTEKSEILGFYDDLQTTQARQTTTFEVYSEPLNPDTYNEIGFGIVSSLFVYLYDVEANNGFFVKPQSDFVTMPLKTSQMGIVHLELKETTFNTF